MTHQRPIPAGNQPPYPRQFAPHEAQETHEAENDAEPQPIDDQGDKGSRAGISGKAALGAAAGIGSAAILAALLYVGRKKADPPR